MANENTAWADGYGFSDESIAVLSKIASEAPGLDLATGDLSEWCARLDAADLPQLSARVRELPEYS